MTGYSQAACLSTAISECADCLPVRCTTPRWITARLSQVDIRQLSLGNPSSRHASRSMGWHLMPWSGICAAIREPHEGSGSQCGGVCHRSGGAAQLGVLPGAGAVGVRPVPPQRAATHDAQRSQRWAGRTGRAGAFFPQLSTLPIEHRALQAPHCKTPLQLGAALRW